MTKSIAYCCLIVAGAVMLVLSAVAPSVLGDSNAILQSLIKDPLLNVLGIIMAITLASAGQLHLAFNAIEERHSRRFLHATRSHLRQAAFMLIWLFLAAVVLLIVKPLAGVAPAVTSIMNGLGLFILLWDVLLLVEITQTVFAIKPSIDEESEVARL